MTIISIVWNASPEIFSIGSHAIRWYGMLFAVSFLLGYLILGKILSRENIPQKEQDLLSLYLILGTVIGARLGHCLFYEWGYYKDHLFELVQVWKGGLASHGGAIGLLAGSIIYSKQFKRSVWWVFDRAVIVIALVACFVRLGNLMNSEIYGKPTQLPWGFIYVRAGETLARHPTQIYEALAYFIIFLTLLLLYFIKKGNIKEGFFSAWFIISLFTARFFIEFVKDVQVDFEHELFINMGQILSIPFILLGFTFLWLAYKREKKKQQTL